MLSALLTYSLLVQFNLAGLVLHESLIVVGSFKWIESQQQHVSYNAETEQIALHSIWFFVIS